MGTDMYFWRRDNNPDHLDEQGILMTRDQIAERDAQRIKDQRDLEYFRKFDGSPRKTIKFDTTDGATMYLAVDSIAMLYDFGDGTLQICLTNKEIFNIEPVNLPGVLLAFEKLTTGFEV